MSLLSVAAIQTTTPARQDTALAHITPLITRAAEAGAQLIFTPECSNLMEQRPLNRDGAILVQDRDIFVQGVQALARQLEVSLIIGSVIVRDPAFPLPVNRALVIGPDGLIKAHYDKIHLFDADTPDGRRYRESERMSPGKTACVCDIAGVRLGLSICYDVRFADLFRTLAKAGVELICVNAAFTVPTGRAHWEVMLRARAIETGAYIIAAAQGGAHEDGRQTWGHSMIVSPWGEVLSVLDHDRPDILVVPLSLEAVDGARTLLPQLKHDRDFAL